MGAEKERPETFGQDAPQIPGPAAMTSAREMEKAGIKVDRQKLRKKLKP